MFLTLFLRQMNIAIKRWIKNAFDPAIMYSPVYKINRNVVEYL